MTELAREWEPLAEAVAKRVGDIVRASGSPWFSTEKAAEYLDLKPKTLQKMRFLGTGPKFAERGKQVRRYHRDDLDRWLREGSGE